MAGHLLALVVGQGEAQRRRHRQQAGGETIACRLGFGVRQLDQDHLAAGALDQRADRGTVAGPLDQVAFPISGHQASLHLRWAFADAGHVADPTPPFAVPGPPAALRLALTQAGEQLAAQLTARHGVDRLVDRLTRSPDDMSVPSSRRLRLPAICSGDHCSRSSVATSANRGLSGASLARRPDRPHRAAAAVCAEPAA